MTVTRDAAIVYALKGWPVFPTRVDKTPYTENGVLDATTDVAQIEAWWSRWPNANIAVSPHDIGMMVLDYDPGADTHKLAENLGGEPPITMLRARTPRGGLHAYYKINPGEIISPSTSKLAPKVDVRGWHSYVLLPPSRTNDGIYTWERESEPAWRTDEMVRLSNTGREKHRDRDTWIIEPDLPENVTVAIDWLKNKAKIATEGEGGDHCAYSTAAYMKSLAISQEKAEELIWDHWNPRCDPPWGPDEYDHLKQKIENGYAYNTSPPGNMTKGYRAARNAEAFKPVKTELPSGMEVTSGRFRVVNWEGMDHIKPPNWLIKDFLPANSYAILFGAPETFKTFIALDIALSLATGNFGSPNPLWSSDVIGKVGPVLFTAGEGREQITKRTRAWSKYHNMGAPVPNFYLADPVPMVADKDQWQQYIDAALALSPDGYRLVVIDTIGRAMSGLNENAAEYVSKFTAMVQQIQHDLKGATVLALHHVGHGADNRERGSGVFRADADVSIGLTRENPKSLMVTIEMHKQKDAAKWDKSVRVKLAETFLTPKISSLVACKPSAEDAPAKVSSFDNQATIVRAVIARIALDTLKSVLGKQWSDRALAKAIAAHKDCSVKSETVRKIHLTALREDSNSEIAPYYDRLADKWILRELVSRDLSVSVGK